VQTSGSGKGRYGGYGKGEGEELGNARIGSRPRNKNTRIAVKGTKVYNSRRFLWFPISKSEYALPREVVVSAHTAI
jgi:hypothetical protein